MFLTLFRLRESKLPLATKYKMPFKRRKIRKKKTRNILYSPVSPMPYPSPSFHSIHRDALINPITGGVSEHLITGGVMQFCITLNMSTTTHVRTLKLGQDMH